MQPTHSQKPSSSLSNDRSFLNNQTNWKFLFDPEPDIYRYIGNPAYQEEISKKYGKPRLFVDESY